jgi:hypothetical protein
MTRKCFLLISLYVVTSGIYPMEIQYMPVQITYAEDEATSSY